MMARSGVAAAGAGHLPSLMRLRLPAAPKSLQIVVAHGDDASRRGLAPHELDCLMEMMLPGRTIMRGAQGPPRVRGADGLQISLSHAAATTALAVAPFPVGIDIERIDPDLDPLTIDAELFGPNDFAFLERQSEALRQDHFYRLWTLKEARLKQLGCDLASAELPQIVISADDTTVAGLDKSAGGGMAAAWLSRADNRFCVAACWISGLVPAGAVTRPG
jgi:phosphopantetheinyl transferase